MVEPLTNEDVDALPPAFRVAAESILLARYQLARQMGMTFNGARDTYTVLGYDASITTQQYRDLYERGGIAGRAVDALPKSVWRGEGDLFEDEDPEVVTAFEQSWREANDRLSLWSTCMRAHILAAQTSFSVLLLGTPPFDFSRPIEKGKPLDLVYVTPFAGGVVNETRGSQTGPTYGDDVVVASWDEDIKSPRFGKPQTYQVRRTNIATPEAQRPVHWSRVIHIPAEGFLDDAVFGPPALKGVWNYFCDLLKVHGGGSEARWLNAHPGMHMDMDKDLSFPDNETLTAEVTRMKASAEEYKHQLTRWIQTRGVKIKSLDAGATTSFKDDVDCLVALIAGTRGIPRRILTGSEEGSLASASDRDNWNDQVKDCRSSYAYPTILRPFISTLIAYGYLLTPKQWNVEWPDVAAMNETQKLAAAETAAKLNDHGEKVITGAEIRETYLGREPLDEVATEDDAQVAQLAAALRKGGTLSLAVKAS